MITITIVVGLLGWRPGEAVGDPPTVGVVAATGVGAGEHPAPATSRTAMTAAGMRRRVISAPYRARRSREEPEANGHTRQHPSSIRRASGWNAKLKGLDGFQRIYAVDLA
jgi:hypothetical protein